MIKNSDNVIKSFEFLTSNFGGVLLKESFSIVIPDGQDGCEPFKDIIYDSYDVNENIDRHGDNSMSMNSYNKHYAIVVERGNCGFNVKALNVQNAGAHLMIVVDIDDNALQRMVTCGYICIYVKYL